MIQPIRLGPAPRRRRLGSPFVHATWTVSDPEVAAVLEWWSANAQHLPWRASRDVYAVWVSEVMSAQTNVGRAAEAWSRVDGPLADGAGAGGGVAGRCAVRVAGARLSAAGT